MKKLAILLLLSMSVCTVLWADGMYYANSGTLAIVTDSGGASVTTVDSGIISTPIPAYRFNTLVAKIKFQTPISPAAIAAGYSDSDTLTIRLRTSLGDGQTITLDSAKLSPPCSLFTKIPLWQDTTTAKAKMLYKDLFWTWKVNDTIADTTVTINQPWYFEVIVKE